MVTTKMYHKQKECCESADLDVKWVNLAMQLYNLCQQNHEP